MAKYVLGLPGPPLTQSQLEQWKLNTLKERQVSANRGYAGIFNGLEDSLCSDLQLFQGLSGRKDDSQLVISPMESKRD